jgi:hypothetical protein
MPSLRDVRFGEAFKTLTLCHELYSTSRNVFMAVPNEDGDGVEDVPVRFQQTLPVGIKVLRLVSVTFDSGIVYPFFPEGMEVLELEKCDSSENAFDNSIVPSSLNKVYISSDSTLNNLQLPQGVQVIRK